MSSSPRRTAPRQQITSLFSGQLSKNCDLSATHASAALYRLVEVPNESQQQQYAQYFQRQHARRHTLHSGATLFGVAAAVRVDVSRQHQRRRQDVNLAAIADATAVVVGRNDILHAHVDAIGLRVQAPRRQIVARVEQATADANAAVTVLLLHLIRVQPVDVGRGEEELQCAVEGRRKARREHVLRRPVAPQVGAAQRARQLVAAVDERAGVRRDVVVRLIQCDQREGGAGQYVSLRHCSSVWRKSHCGSISGSSYTQLHRRFSRRYQPKLLSHANRYVASARFWPTIVT